MTVEDIVQNVDTGVTIAADVALAAAPLIAIGKPEIGAAMQLLVPIAESFIIKGGNLIVQFRKDVTPTELIAALQASSSANWPTPPSITPLTPGSGVTMPAT